MRCQVTRRLGKWSDGVVVYWMETTDWIALLPITAIVQYSKPAPLQYSKFEKTKGEDKMKTKQLFTLTMALMVATGLAISVWAQPPQVFLDC